MKLLIFTTIIFPLISSGQVVFTPNKIEVTGFIKGDAEILGVFGDTLDYFIFEVKSPGQFTANALMIGGARFMLAEIIEGETGFGFVDNPYRLEVFPGTPADSPLPTFTRNLEIGTYVMVAGRGGSRTSYDVYDGFVAVNPEGGGFSLSIYSYELLGDVNPLEFRSGNLDNTFAITSYAVPEPTTYALLGSGLLLFFITRKYCF